MLYKKILVALDGSACSQRGLDKAIEIAKKNQATLILTHVFDVRTLGSLSMYDNYLVDRALTALDEMMDNYKKHALNKGVKNVEICIEHGSPKIVIPMKILSKQNVDLVICGSTGKGIVERFLIGSVSKEIIKNAHCDVLVVK